MNYNFILALLAKYTTMTPEEAKQIALELSHAIIPVKYEDAERIVNELVERIDIK